MDPDAELLGNERVRLPRAAREVERLDRGEPWRPPRRLVVWVVLVVVVGVVAGSAWNSDRRARAAEAAALGTCREELRNAAVSSDLEMMAVAGDLRPRLASTDPRQHAAALRVLSNPARALLPEVLLADHRCRAVSVRPWHLSLGRQQQAATSYSSALATRLREIAADGSAYFSSAASLRRLRDGAHLGVLGGRW